MILILLVIALFIFQIVSIFIIMDSFHEIQKKQLDIEYMQYKFSHHLHVMTQKELGKKRFTMLHEYIREQRKRWND